MELDALKRRTEQLEAYIRYHDRAAAMRLHKQQPPKQPPLKAIEPWSVRYTAELDDGATHEWVETFQWNSSDKDRAAGHALLSMKYGQYSQIFDGRLYPPHRLRSVSWEVL